MCTGVFRLLVTWTKEKKNRSKKRFVPFDRSNKSVRMSEQYTFETYTYTIKRERERDREKKIMDVRFRYSFFYTMVKMRSIILFIAFSQSFSRLDIYIYIKFFNF